MIYLKYHPGYETGKNLLEALQTQSDQVIKASKLKKIVKDDILIRWGDSSDEDLDNHFISRGGKVFNKRTTILSNTNKLKSLQVFKRAGLNSPEIYTTKTSIKKFPVLGRDRNHHGGLDIVIIDGNNKGKNNFTKIPDKDFYVEMLQSRKEYRIHILNGKVIRVTQKIFRGHDKDGNEITEKGVIKNDTYGWGHRNIEFNEIEKQYLDEAIKALKASGLDFGAVDLLIEKGTDKPFVLEINSAPRLNVVGIEIYTKNFLSLLMKPKLTTKAKLFIPWKK